MNQAPPATAPATIRALRAALDSAPDSQIMRIVGMVDDMPDRMSAEAIIAPVRARLRPLRPERKLNFRRLLFGPLDPILVDASAWRPAHTTVPRSAIRPLADLAGADGLEAQIDAEIGTATSHDALRISQLGATLWPMAAARLHAATQPPPAWKQAGLPDISFVPLAQAIAGCLAAAPLLEGMGDPTADAAHTDQALANLLRQAARTGPVAWGVMLCLLLCAVPHAGSLHQIALQPAGAAALRQAQEQALEHAWDWAEAACTGAPHDLMQAAAGLRQRAMLLRALSAARGHRERASELLGRLHTAYLHHLDDVARDRMVSVLAAVQAPPDDAAMNRLEALARGLRRLGLELRGVAPPGAANGDEILRDTAAAAACSALPAIDRARLIEILDSPDAAMKLLAG